MDGRVTSLLHRAARFTRSRLRAFASFFAGRTLRDLAPGIIAIVMAPFLVVTICMELKEPLFSDTLVFQYTGWCIRHGMRLYRDVGMADGPLIHYVHALIQVFVGIGDRGFRKADLFLQITGSALIGGLLAPVTDSRPLARWLTRGVWAATAATIWLSWYFLYGWEGTTQREAFYALFGSVGMVLLYASSVLRARAATAAIFAGAFLVTSEVFGKPACVFYPVAGAACLLFADPGAALDRRRRAKVFVAGAGAFVGLLVVLFVVSGSFSGYVRWCFEIPVLSNGFLFRTSRLKLFVASYWDRYSQVMAFATFAGVASVAAGVLPARALCFVVIPPLAYASACLQGRGFNYQLIPMTASAHVLLLLVLSGLWRRDRASDGVRDLVAAIALSFAGYYAFSNLQDSHLRWSGDESKWDVPEHTSCEDEKKVGAFIKAHTGPDDRVFAYTPGNAHEILLTAERRTASPFFHAYWLDPVGLLSQSSVRPTPKELADLTNLQTENRRMACDAVKRDEPAAVAFDSMDMAYAICPDLHAMIADDFDLATTIGPYRVYLRKHAR